jgi:hypothetical protein
MVMIIIDFVTFHCIFCYFFNTANMQVPLLIRLTCFVPSLLIDDAIQVRVLVVSFIVMLHIKMEIYSFFPFYDSKIMTNKFYLY